MSILDPFIDFYYAYILGKKYRFVKTSNNYTQFRQIRAVKGFTIHRDYACEGLLPCYPYTPNTYRDFSDGINYFYKKIKRGDLGGAIEDESCLSHNGNCWVDINCCVSNGIIIQNNAFICCPSRRNTIYVTNISRQKGKLYIIDNAYVSNDISYNISPDSNEDSYIMNTSYITTSLNIHSPCNIYGNTRISGDPFTIDEPRTTDGRVNNKFYNTGDIEAYRQRQKQRSNDYRQIIRNFTTPTVTDSDSIVGVSLSDSSIVDVNGNIVALVYNSNGTINPQTFRVIEPTEPAVMSAYNPLYSTSLPSVKESKETKETEEIEKPKEPEVIKRKILNNLDGIEI